MARLDSEDKMWLEVRFSKQNDHLDRNSDHISQMRADFAAHVTRDDVTAQALTAHIEECKGSKVRRRKTWRFWVGIVATIAAGISAVIVEHWWFANSLIKR